VAAPDVDALIAAAYARDREGDEAGAVAFYDAAWQAGVATTGSPAGHDLAGFMLGYGSTLKNVGRVDESRAILAEARRRFPEDRALRLFAALSDDAAGRHGEALAEAIEVALSLAAHAPDVARYARALGEYAALLRARDDHAT